MAWYIQKDLIIWCKLSENVFFVMIYDPSVKKFTGNGITFPVDFVLPILSILVLFSTKATHTHIIEDGKMKDN